MQLKFKRLSNGAGLPLPSRATLGAAGIDICSAQAWEIPPRTSATVRTGFAVEIPHDYELQCRGRSGWAFKHSILAHMGTIDSDYRGEIQVRLFNFSDKPFLVQRGDRIAQLVLAPVISCEITEADELSETERGEGGFGSTGT